MKNTNVRTLLLLALLCCTGPLAYAEATSSEPATVSATDGEGVILRAEMKVALDPIEKVLSALYDARLEVLMGPSGGMAEKEVQRWSGAGE